VAWRFLRSRFVSSTLETRMHVGWGPSFSAPFVLGRAVLLHPAKFAAINQSSGAAAVAHGVPLRTPAWANGRLDLCATLASVSTRSCFTGLAFLQLHTQRENDYCGTANYLTASATPLHSSTQTVTWTCTGAPPSRHARYRQRRHRWTEELATAMVTLSTMTRVLAPPLGLPRYAPPMPTWWHWLHVSPVLRFCCCFAL